MKILTSRAACLGAAALPLYVGRVLNCLASTLAFTIAAPQSWPARVDYAGDDDKARTVAVDHRGNVLVVGTVTTINGDTDAFCISYDPTGAVNWYRNYDDANHGDDYGTGVAVDWDGNVYVSGVSYGGSTRKGDFFVMKMRPSDGFPVWPSSGTHTGYDVYNGAIRLSDDSDDGYDPIGGGGDDPVDDQMVCAIAVEPTSDGYQHIAITGPTKATPVDEYHVTFTHWRTVVFEYDATDGVKLRSGWPVDNPTLQGDGYGGDDYGTCVPYAVAINAYDHSVYATGTVEHIWALNYQGVTVRFFPDGNDHGVTNEQWENNETGPSSAHTAMFKSIALDPYSSATDPDVYFVAGALQEHESTFRGGYRGDINIPTAGDTCGLSKSAL